MLGGSCDAYPTGHEIEDLDRGGDGGRKLACSFGISC